MKQQQTALGRLKVLLLAIGLASTAQPSLASDNFDKPVPGGAPLEQLRAPSYLGGVSLERQRSWQPAAAYQLGMLSRSYGPATVEREAGPSTPQSNIGIDSMQTATIIPGVFGSD